MNIIRCSSGQSGFARFCPMVLPTMLALAACASPGPKTPVTPEPQKDAAPGSPSDAVAERPDAKPTDLALPTICKADAGPPTKGKGERCVCDGECRTDRCVDGVCCSSACDDRCKACN